MINIFDTDFLSAWSERQQAEVDAVPTHLPSWNRAMRDDGGGLGMAPGWMCVIGANPGGGKSAMALNMASSALAVGESVGMISLEMSGTQLATRLYSLASGTPGTALRLLEKGSFAELAWASTHPKFDKLPPVWVPKELMSDWREILDYANRLRDQGCRYFILDHLQCVALGDEEALFRGIQRVISELRAWAVKTKSIVVVCSQFNRSTSSLMETPRPSGLWGGHTIESHADVICLLDHSKYERSGNIARTWCCLAKNRHGPCLNIPVEWNYRRLVQREATPDEEHLWPT